MWQYVLVTCHEGYGSNHLFFTPCRSLPMAHGSLTDADARTRAGTTLHHIDESTVYKNHR